MGHLNLFKKILFIISIVCAAVFTLSGCYLLVTYLTREKTGVLDKILIQNVDQSNTLSIANESMFPGDSKSFALQIESQLVENVNYELSFVDHQVTSDDKFFYVSISDDNGEFIVNNTLDQIFNDNISIKRGLKSYEKETLYFTFSISSILNNEDFEYVFSILFKANGRMTN